MKKIYKSGLRGLAIVLLTTALLNINANALIIDDIKAYLGYTVEERFITSVDGKEEITIDDEVAEFDYKIKESTKLIQNIKNRIDSECGKLKQKIKNEPKVAQILSQVKAIENVKQQLNITEDTKRSLDKAQGVVKRAINALRISGIDIDPKIETVDYEIGNIGNSSNFIVESDNISIVSPYGYKINNDGSLEKKNNGIEISADADSKILAQWNGQVVNIENDENIEGLKTVTIFHGNSLYTTYSHLSDISVNIGNKVNEKDKIGEVGNTTLAEPNKINHVEYKVMLENKYVNPLLIYGNRGQAIYNKWLDEYKEVYTVETGEYQYYSESISKVNPNKNNNGNTVDGAATLPDGYVKPNPGIVIGVAK